AYAFETRYYPGIPRLSLHPITDEAFTIAALPFVPLPVLHLKLPVFGYRIGDFSYITDANFIPQSTMDKLQGTRTLVLNALQKESRTSHINQDAALEIVAMARPATPSLTRVSHKMCLAAKVGF